MFRGHRYPSLHRRFLLAVGYISFALTSLSLRAQESANWAVTTFAGQAGIAGPDDGLASAARFNGPRGIAADTSGNIYIADTINQTIRKITPGGQVSTFAGLAGQMGFTDGVGNAARFNEPAGLAIDGSNNLFVADLLNNAIRKIAPDGTVSTLAGATNGSLGNADGTGANAQFSQPIGVTTDSSGNIYVADSGNSALRKITPNGAVSTIAVTSGSPLFNNPYGVAVDSAGIIYVADTFNNVIRTVSASGTVSTLAGAVDGSAGSADGTGNSAQFSGPNAIALNSAGALYITESGNHDVRTISNGAVTRIAGTPSGYGSQDGAGNTCYLNAPQGVATTPDGTVYVCDTLNSTIRKLVRVQASSTPSTPAPPSTPSDPSGPTDSSARFINISTRSFVGTGDNVLIAGFIIGGTTPKKVLIRASGPVLIPLGVTDALADPVVELHDNSAQQVIATNDNWSDEPVNAAAVLQANQQTNTRWVAGSKDAALVETLAPGGYTAIVSGKNSGTGIALIEVFELDNDGASKLVNISTRSQVKTGDGVQIAGFIITGSAPKKVLIRAGGPYLSQFGVSGVLADPVIELHNANSVIATNDDWSSDPTYAATVQQAFQSTGNPYTVGSRDAAIVTTLAPGGYTAIVSGKNGTQGVALIEVDELPQ